MEGERCGRRRMDLDLDLEYFTFLFVLGEDTFIYFKTSKVDYSNSMVMLY